MSVEITANDEGPGWEREVGQVFEVRPVIYNMVIIVNDK